MFLMLMCIIILCCFMRNKTMMTMMITKSLKPSTGIFSFPPHLFRAATLLWETVETKYHEFSLRLLIFSMLQYKVLTAKLSPYYFAYLLYNLRFIIEQ